MIRQVTFVDRAHKPNENAWHLCVVPNSNLIKSIQMHIFSWDMCIWIASWAYASSRLVRWWNQPRAIQPLSHSKVIAIIVKGNFKWQKTVVSSFSTLFDHFLLQEHLMLPSVIIYQFNLTIKRFHDTKHSSAHRIFNRNSKWIHKLPVKFGVCAGISMYLYLIL